MAGLGGAAEGGAMTDLLDAPVARPVEASESQVTPDTPEREAGPLPAHWLLAGLLLGTGAIHLAMVPSHLGESAVEGAGFVAAAWAQLLLAVALLVRPRREMLYGAVAVNLACVAAWAVSRTAGLPFGAHAGHAETVSFVDGACVALEVAAMLVAVALLVGVGGAGLVRARGLAAAGAVGALLVATAAVSSPAARDHAAGSHGDHGDAAGGPAHDHGAAAAATPAHDHGDMAATRGAATTEDDLGFGSLSNGHQHEHGNGEPLTDAERVTLAGQIAQTSELVERFPTIAAAEAAGWHRAGPFSPGLGTHYQGPTGGLGPDIGAVPLLVFDGLGPDAPLAGFMYMTYGDGEPEGFAGPNDHWHYHERVCIVSAPDGSIDTPFGADLEGVTEQMCQDAGGAFIRSTGYMVHMWSVPGYESPDGMFTELNRKITCPDGTYHRIEIEETGHRDTTCLNP
jgi:hypothetical protein